MHLLSQIGRRALFSRLAALHNGHLEIVDGGVVTSWGDQAVAPVTIRVHDARFYSAVAFGGSVSAGESYGGGWWDCSDLTALVRLMLRNRDVLDGIDSGLGRLATPARRLYHALNRNTRSRSRRNIAAHYDLSNDFFATFLDETMTYSCGVFDAPDTTMRDASIAKYDRVAKLLDLQASDRIIEIGSGWGGFAIHAASTYGCMVTTTTISEEQFAMATARVAEAGLTDRVTVLKSDYRDLRGRFDGLVSIEMIEAVGHEHYDTFFATCSSLLRPHGRAVIQAITIRDDQYESARREVDFIKRHIFPGSCIPSREVLYDAAQRSGLQMVRADEMGLHYAETLRRWNTALSRNSARISELGFDERFRRMWEFYFCYCEGGFMERAIGTAQLVFAPAMSAFRRPIAVAAIPRAPLEEVAA